MPDTIYRDPLNKFLELGRPDTHYAEDWTDYVSEYNLTDEHIPDLLKMLEEHTQPVDDFDEENPASWTAIHVWRALGQLKNVQTIRPLIDAMLRDAWEDWGWEDIPQAIALIGEPAIEPVQQELEQRAAKYELHPTWFHRTLQHIGNNNPVLQEKAENIFIEQLEKAETNDASLNAFIIDTFMNWKTEKALPVIEKAYADDYVDTGILGDWDDFQVGFGLKTLDEVDVAAKKALRKAQMMRQMGMNTLNLGDLDSFSSSSGDKEKKKKKAQRKNKKKMQMQNRKKKKKK